MSKYRKSSSTRRSGYGQEKRVSIGWLWLISGIFVGALGAVFIYERFTNLKPNSDARTMKARAGTLANKASTNHTQSAPKHVQSPKTDTKAQNTAPQTVQEFEFYTLLPGMEVQVPSNQGTKTQAKPPLQQPSANNQINPPAAVMTTKPACPASNAKQSSLKKTPSPPTATKVGNTTAPAADTKRYIIEAGMFRNFGEADSLKAKLALQGFNPHIQKVMTERGETWFRVALGPYYSESLANTQKQSLLALKVRGIVIVHKAQ